MANTGYKIQPQLKKVSDDINEYPLDINNNRTSLSGLPQATMPNDSANLNYRVLDESTCPRTPAVVHYSLVRDMTPYIDGNMGLQKNGGSSELITFVGTGNSSLGFNIGDTMTVNTFHYHLAVRWADDASLTVNIRQGNISGTILYTYTGGAVSVADVNSHSLTLTEAEYTVEVYTTSNDTSLKNPSMAYELINNTSLTDGQLKISVTDQTTSLIMLGESPSQIGIPNNGTNRLGSYNMKNDSNLQELTIENTTGSAVSATLTTVPNGGSFTQTLSIPSGITTFTPFEKVGFRLTVN